MPRSAVAHATGLLACYRLPASFIVVAVVCLVTMVLVIVQWPSYQQGRTCDRWRERTPYIPRDVDCDVHEWRVFS